MQDIDRSYLSQPEVVQASRKWICIRLATYENEKEAAYLAQVFRGRSGQLENTVFTFMDPEASQHLIRPGRGPRELFNGPGDMAREMDRLARSYPPSTSQPPSQLPKVKSLKLALNVAACESLPVVVVTSGTVERKLATAAWSRQNLGQAVYVRADVEGKQEAYILKPDKFGLKIENYQKIDPDLSAPELFSFLSKFQSERKNHHAHVQEGKERGILWETKVPVTDPQARY